MKHYMNLLLKYLYKLLKFLQIYKSILLLIWVPLLVSFLIQLIEHKTFFSTFTWIITNSAQFLAGYIIVFLIIFAFVIISNRLYVGVIFAIIIFILPSIVNFYKLNIKGEPLYPWDLFILNDFMNIVGSFKITISYRIISILFLLLVQIVIVKKTKVSSLNFLKRCLLSFITLIILFFLTTQIYFSGPLENYAKIVYYTWAQPINYNKNGFILAFSSNIKSILIDKPKDYNSNKIHEISKSSRTSIIITKEMKIKPNIIMIMGEAFWDPTILKNLEFSIDPLPTFHRLQKNAISGNVFSPVYGGLTANTEFEALTGFSLDFLPNGSVAFQQYINKDFNSLASILNRQGYYSLAIHPYHGTFWNRKSVYEKFGFDNYLSIENLEKLDYNGYFVSDKYITDVIIEEYKKHSDKPFFNFSITMENHYPYDKGKYKESNDIKITNPILDSNEIEILKNYTIGISHADNMLNELVTYFSNIKDPTIIVFFGDHLPILGNNFSIFKKLGFISGENNLEDKRNLYSTPIIIWDNYSNNNHKLDTIDAAFISPYLLESIQLAMPNYFMFLNSMRNKIQAFGQGININKNIISKFDTNEQVHLKENFRLIQYNYMFGKRYEESELYNSIN